MLQLCMLLIDLLIPWDACVCGFTSCSSSMPFYLFFPKNFVLLWQSTRLFFVCIVLWIHSQGFCWSNPESPLVVDFSHYAERKEEQCCEWSSPFRNGLIRFPSSICRFFMEQNGLPCGRGLEYPTHSPGFKPWHVTRGSCLPEKNRWEFFFFFVLWCVV